MRDVGPFCEGYECSDADVSSAVTTGQVVGPVDATHLHVIPAQAEIQRLSHARTLADECREDFREASEISLQTRIAFVDFERSLVHV